MQVTLAVISIIVWDRPPSTLYQVLDIADRGIQS